MNGCIYRTKDGECDLYSEGGKYHAWCEMDGCDGRKMSNGDHIRAMSDEELASTLGYCCPAEGAVPESDCDAFGNCTECWLKWLKQEAKNERVDED